MAEFPHSLFREEDYQNSFDRINRLTADTKGLWGKMSVSQMLAHCCEVQEVLNGKELRNTPLIARIFKKMVRRVAIGTKPYKKGEITHPQYVISSDPSFEREKARLLAALSAFKADTGPGKHILFGELSVEERGWTAFKHLNHHLTQFGV